MSGRRRRRVFRTAEAWTAPLYSDHAAGPQFSDFRGREAEPAAVDFVVVLAELGAGRRFDRLGPVVTQGRGRHGQGADLVVLDLFEKAALVHVAVVHDLVDIAHRRQRDAVALGERENLHLAERLRPAGDQRVGLLAVLDPRGIVGEAGIVARVL